MAGCDENDEGRFDDGKTGKWLMVGRFLEPRGEPASGPSDIDPVEIIVGIEPEGQSSICGD